MTPPRMGFVQPAGRVQAPCACAVRSEGVLRSSVKFCKKIQGTGSRFCHGSQCQELLLAENDWTMCPQPIEKGDREDEKYAEAYCLSGLSIQIRVERLGRTAVHQKQYEQVKVILNGKSAGACRPSEVRAPNDATDSGPMLPPEAPKNTMQSAWGRRSTNAIGNSSDLWLDRASRMLRGGRNPTMSCVAETMLTKKYSKKHAMTRTGHRFAWLKRSSKAEPVGTGNTRQNLSPSEFGAKRSSRADTIASWNDWRVGPLKPYTNGSQNQGFLHRSRAVDKAVIESAETAKGLGAPVTAISHGPEAVPCGGSGDIALLRIYECRTLGSVEEPSYD
ncbi:hypothetical protein BC629DRAFT_1435234 [Irpex lacteus]|nr:hypothetical protein BC629DRAFT_1435234 [Irpex lacteus]